MRAARIVAALAAILAVTGAGRAQAPAEHIVFVHDGDLWVARADGRDASRLTRSTASETAPALAPGGLRIAYASNRSGENEIYVARSDGAEAEPVTRNPRRDDVSPAWSPDGRRLAWASGGDIFVMNADGSAKRALAASAADELDPAWSPDGREIAYTAGGDLFAVPAAGGPSRRLTSGPAVDGRPDWSSGGEVAFVSDGAVHVVPAAGGLPRRATSGPLDSSPSWAPGGRRLVFARARTDGSDLYVVQADGTGLRRLIAGGAEPDWGVLAEPAPSSQEPPKDELLPDLDQRAPAGLSVTEEHGRFKLGFASAVDNVGRGPVWIVSSRRSRAVPVMRADQLVALRGGGRRVYRNVGITRYTRAPPHYHWHYMGFERYELRRAGDFEQIVRDHKSGFCLADHYGHARGRVRVAPARFLGKCGQLKPRARRIVQGSSVGYTDRYPAHFHGQNVDVTGVPPGHYWLVHRANARHLLRELRYGNNDAAVLIALTWPEGRRSVPSVRVLRVCEGRERCGLGL